MAREKLPDWSRLWDDFIQEELRDEELNGGKHMVDDEIVALASKVKKGKKISSEDDKKKKDMNKVKCFACHKFRHYVGQCPNKKKRVNETQPEVAASTKAQMDEFAKKFEQLELLLVSQTTLGTITIDALIDSGAICHMTGTQEVFKSFTESDSDLYVELGMGTKHAVQGSGTMPFWMESEGMLRVINVLWVS